jgi:hypothetical protein
MPQHTATKLAALYNSAASSDNANRKNISKHHKGWYSLM